MSEVNKVIEHEIINNDEEEEEAAPLPPPVVIPILKDTINYRGSPTIYQQQPPSNH